MVVYSTLCPSFSWVLEVYPTATFSELFRINLALLSTKGLSEKMTLRSSFVFTNTEAPGTKPLLCGFKVM